MWATPAEMYNTHYIFPQLTCKCNQQFGRHMNSQSLNYDLGNSLLPSKQHAENALLWSFFLFSTLITIPGILNVSLASPLR